ncbi:S-adenosyl-L-methionine-dependent methyltransferase [Marasmius fiardii PR-910]|nr:S-adenosyl-L-methionine-dependent methyltransferase [Marasmius fiardii PR-910]
MTSNTSSRAQIKALLDLINSSAEEAMAEYEKTGHDIPSPGSKKSHPLDSQPGAIALKRAIRTLEGACERLCTTLAQPMHTLLNRVMPCEASCLHFVTEEGIADILETGTNAGAEGMHVDEIAVRTKNRVSSEKLGNLMLLLASRGCFNEVSKDVYANNRISLTLLSSNPISPTISLYSGPAILQTVAVLPEALVHPGYALSKAVNKTAYSYLMRKEMEDTSFFDWLKTNVRTLDIFRFQQGMAGLSRINGGSDAATHVSGEEHITFCDVGSGIGAVALALSKLHANKFRFVLQDLPETLEHARSLWGVENPEANVDFVPIDFLKEPPVPKRNVYYMSLVIHDWPDTDAITILKSVASVMNDTSRLILHEHVLQHCHPQQNKDSNESSEIQKEPLLPNYGSGSIRTHNLNVAMLTFCNSFERTSEDFIALGHSAGLKLVKIWPLSDTCLIEYRLTEGGN